MVHPILWLLDFRVQTNLVLCVTDRKNITCKLLCIKCCSFSKSILIANN
jgi:hypothetical protein